MEDQPYNSSSPSLRSLCKEDIVNNSGRKSCEFTSHASSCIQKATTNLHQLEDRLQEWCTEFLQFNQNLQATNEKKLLNFNNKKLLRTPTHKLEPIKSGSRLEVFRHEITKSSLDNHEEKSEEKPPLPKECENMTQNVLHLLGRLETDRVNMVDLFNKEEQRTASLHEKIDKLAYERIHNLPLKVQQEHEKCAHDLQELKWHCAYQSQIEGRLREKVRQAENISNKINTEIAFVEENSPLIEGKLCIEREAMVVIQEKQDKSSAELKAVQDKLKDIEMEFEITKKHADHEQRLLAGRLITLSDELNGTLVLFLSSQKEHENMVENIAKLQAKMATDEDEFQSLDKKAVRLKEIEDHLELQLEELTEKIFEQTSKHKEQVKANEGYEKQKQDKANGLQAMSTNFHAVIDSKSKEYRKRIISNRDSEREIKELRQKIDFCEKQKVADAKAVKRAIIERENIQADLQVVSEETENTRLIHEKLLLSLDQERVKTVEAEENLNLQCDSLKKQNKEENHARMTLQARINVDTSDFAKRKRESEIKREKMLKTANDIESVVATVDVQVETLSSKHEERVKAIEALDKLLEQIETKHKSVEESLTSKIQSLQPKEKNYKVALSEIKEKQKVMDETSQQLERRLRDMASSSIMMNKLLLANQKTIEELNEELAELQIQLDSGQGLEKTLNESLEEVQGRSTEQARLHENQMQIRLASLENAKKSLKRLLQENRALAVRYIDLQSQHINSKNQYVNTYETSMLAEDSLKDKQNLCDLHARLHEALKSYYELRGIQTKAGISRFEQMTQNSNKKLNAIQTELERSIDNIATFLDASNKSHKLVQVENSVRKTAVQV